MDVIQLMMRLIKAGILTQPSDIPDEMLSEELLSNIYKISNMHDVSHLVAQALNRNEHVRNYTVWNQFEMSLMLATYRYAMIRHECDSICATLEEAEIPHIPLKGMVIRDLYPEPWMRTSCDIDILIREQDVEKAVERLTSGRGYRVDHKGYHDISLYSLSDVHLELHFSVLENEETMDQVLGRVWDYAAPVEEGSFRYCLTNEFLLFHLVAHTAHHFGRGGCGLRPMLDFWILKDRLVTDEKIFGGLLREAGLTRFYEAALKLSDVWFGDAEPDEVTLKMQSFIICGGTYGTTEQSVMVNYARKNKGRVGYLFSVLFMPYSRMCIKYPFLKKVPVLLPVMWIVRIVTAFFKGRMGYFKGQVRASKRASQTDRQETVALLTDLGLLNE